MLTTDELAQRRAPEIDERVAGVWGLTQAELWGITFGSRSTRNSLRDPAAL
jgi:hypothetical protein